jgi:hypothetical protein
MRFCSLCNGPLKFLGTLGRREAWQCQSCGAECSRPVEDTDLESDAADAVDVKD